MEFVLKYKNGQEGVFKLSLTKGGPPDKKRLINLIRNLQDDKYDITEDIKQDGIKTLSQIAKDNNYV